MPTSCLNTLCFAAVLFAAGMLAAPRTACSAPVTKCTISQTGSVDFGVLSPDVNNVVTATTTPTIFVCKPIVGGGTLSYTVTYTRGVRNNNTLANLGGAGPYTIGYVHSITSPLTGAASNNVPVSLNHSGTVSNYENAYCNDPIASCPYADTIIVTITY